MIVGEQFNLDCYLKVCGCISHNGFLTRAGYRAFDKAVQPSYLDKVGSVSALVDVDVPLDLDYDENHTELNYGT